MPKSKPERGHHLVTEVLARKELWEQFEKELSGGYRQETTKSGNNLASSIKSSLPAENLNIKHRGYRLGLTSTVDREKGRPSSAGTLRSSAVTIMRKPVLPKGTYSPAIAGRTDEEKVRPSSASALRSTAMNYNSQTGFTKGTYSPAIAGRTDEEKVRPSSASALRSTAMIIMRKPVLPKGAYSPAIAGRTDEEKVRPSSAGALRSTTMIIMRKPVLPKGAYSPAMPGRAEVPDQGWVRPDSINRGNRNMYVIDSNSLQTGKQQLKRELLRQQTPGRWQGQFYSRKPGPFNLLQLPIRTNITNKSVMIGPAPLKSKFARRKT